jgi:hypothetical protein
MSRGNEILSKKVEERELNLKKHEYFLLCSLSFVHLVYIDCKYIGNKFPLCLILMLFFPIEWVPVPVPMGRKKTLSERCPE